VSKTIASVGIGPGVSTAVAATFGAEGFSVALIARSHAPLDVGVEALKAWAISARRARRRLILWSPSR
jgi:NADP-dependent 3-hydroxy acid dehydrogenase YdfG